MTTDPSGSITVDLLISGASALSLLSLAAGAADEPDRADVRGAAGEPVEPTVAVDSVCAWPNLTLLPDGTIVATIHNQPSHLKQPADVECWASEDEGRTSTKRGARAPRDRGPRRWRVGNSWGDDKGRGQKGFYTMNDSWFDEYLFEIAAPKSRLPQRRQIPIFLLLFIRGF